MAQLGSGNSSSYPLNIDTKQVFQNGTPLAPDSPTRLDSEFANDSLSAIVNVETTLGARVQGTFASLAARLNQFIPGGGVVPNVISFSQRLILTIAGAVHNLGSPGIIYQVYDQGSPRAALEPSTVTVDQTNYDLEMTFAVPQDGVVVLGAPSPQYVMTFTGATHLQILGTAHGLGLAELFYAIYDDSTPAAAIDAGPLTIHPTNYDVDLYFAVPQNGFLILSVGGPRYRTTFSGVPSLTIPGTIHQLGSAALLYQCYDNSVPAEAFKPATVTVDPVSFNVELTFGSDTSGSVVLTPVAQLSGQDFDVRDAGIVDQTAVRVFSNASSLNLQAGADEHVTVRDALGLPVATFDTANERLGLGTTAPTHQLTLALDSAAKPGSNLWSTISDERLKDVVGAYTDGLELILQIHPIWYRYNGQGGIPRSPEALVGLLAQALQPLAPYMVRSYRGRLTPDSEEIDLLTYEGHAMTFALINAVQELAARVVALETTQALLLAQQARPEETSPC